jgi:ankyrin repeat protein
MKPSTCGKLQYYFRNVLYLLVLYAYSFCYAGSYDDFFAAIKRDDPKLVIVLLQRGFDANTRDANGQSGLILALRESSLKVASVLIHWPKTNIEIRTAQDESPLMLAALKGFFNICQQLIAQDADVNKPGWTPLHYAATSGQLQIMRLLLENHAYVDASSPNGSTPLMMAARYGSPEAVKLLLEEGADPLLKNEQGLSAIDFAHGVNRLDAAALISAFVRARQPKGSW